MAAAGEFVDFDQVVREQETRDRQDANRAVGRLMKADDAVEVNTDHQSLEQVVEKLEEIVKARMQSLSNRYHVLQAPLRKGTSCSQAT